MLVLNAIFSVLIRESNVSKAKETKTCLFLTQSLACLSTFFDSTFSLYYILETYIKLKDCVILHVMSATTNYSTSESTKITKKFDEYGDRTLHVCTKADKASEDMVAVVTTNYMGPDYVFVRNRLGDETDEEARAKEASLFETHHLLSKIDKSLMGVRVVAQKLLLIQLESISKCLRELVWFINKDLNTCVVRHERSQQQHNFKTVSEAMPAFVQIINESQQSLGKLMFNEFDEFPDETQMDCRTRLREMTSEFSQKLAKQDEEVRALEERKGSLEQAFHFLFERKIADMSTITCTFVSRVWDYIGFVIIKVLELHAQNSYPQLFLALKKAANKVIARQKESFKGRLLELLDMKKMRGYTHDVGDIYTWSDLKKNMVACLEMVRKNFLRLADLDIPNMVLRVVAPEMEPKMVNELKSDGEIRYKPMLKESPSMTLRRWKLKNRIELLEKLKKVVENTMDEISFYNL
ncbi:putative dynamin central domain, dynamin GTPase effector, Dynamin superfamily [Helianthus anomalus]